MNTKRFQMITKTLFAFVMAFALAGCSSYLDNPLKDRETGEDINLLVIDFNFFHTRISVKMADARSGEVITVPATIRFTGDNGSDIVSFSGDKREQITTTQGQIEVTIDPNVAISSDSPFQFAVHVEADGYVPHSKGFQFQTEGKKTIELKLAKISDEEESELGGEQESSDDGSFTVSGISSSSLKSALAEEEPYQITYHFTIEEMLKYKDSSGQFLFSSESELREAYDANPSDFFKLSFSKNTNHDPETGVVNIGGSPVSVLFQKLETGRLTGLVLGGKEVADLNGGVIVWRCSYTGTPAPDLFGFAVFDDQAWDIGAEMIYNQLNSLYTIAKASTTPLCATGSNITFRSNVISSFSIDADVYDAGDNLLTTLHFKGSFPETFAVENTPQQAVKIVFRNNNPAFQPISPLEIPDFCSGSYEVNVAATSGYNEYQIVLKAFCPNNPTIAIAPTYSGEYKIKDSANPWQGVDMAGGVVDLLGLPNQEYEYRLLWENEWEYSNIVTEFDSNGNYLHSSGSTIHSEMMDDGRIRIHMEHLFSQNVCDDMGW